MFPIPISLELASFLLFVFFALEKIFPQCFVNIAQHLIPSFTFKQEICPTIIHFQTNDGTYFAKPMVTTSECLVKFPIAWSKLFTNCVDANGLLLLLLVPPLSLTRTVQTFSPSRCLITMATSCVFPGYQGQPADKPTGITAVKIVFLDLFTSRFTDYYIKMSSENMSFVCIDQHVLQIWPVIVHAPA